MNTTLRTPYLVALAVSIVAVTGLFFFGGTIDGRSSAQAESTERAGQEDEDPSPIKAAGEHALTAADTETNVTNASIGSEVLTRDDVEILWLARILYSETKRAPEQRLIAWIVRNRVETNFRGSTYKEVALSAKQFSGLHAGDKQYYHNISRTFDSKGEAWENALAIARDVYWADGSERPFSITVRHFYSPKAVTNHPEWAHGKAAIHTIVDPHSGAERFAFYDGVK